MHSLLIIHLITYPLTTRVTSTYTFEECTSLGLR